MKFITALTIILIPAIFQCCESQAQTFDPVYDISNVMSDLLKTAPNRILYKNHEKRHAFAWDINRASTENDVPDLLMTVNIFKESSFRKDALSENTEWYGLGQMHGVASANCDIETRIGQLRCSAKWLRFCYDKCGTWSGAITAYKTRGYCTTENKTLKWRVSSIIQMWFKYEEQRAAIRAEIIDDIEHYASLKGE